MVALGESPQPLYLRVYRLIADEIASGSLGPGDRLPPSGSSRSASACRGRPCGGRSASWPRTASSRRRRAAARSSPTGPLVEPPNALLSFTELGNRHGLQATARVLRLDERPATIEEAEAFGVAPGADLVELERLRLLDAVPVAVDATRFPLARVAARADVDFATASLYDCSSSPASRPSGRPTPSRPSPHRSGRARCSGSGGASPCSSRKRQRTIPATGSSSWRGRTTGRPVPLPRHARPPSVNEEEESV